jgi:hypothetical protein
MQEENPVPPKGTRAERIAYNEGWSRSLNERRAEIADALDAVAGFRCECWQSECNERIRLSGEDWTQVRSQPNRFAVAPGHVAEQFEAVVTAYPHFWLIEKFGEAGDVAEELA